MSQLDFHSNNPPPTASGLPILNKAVEAYKLWHKLIPHIEKSSRYTIGNKIDEVFLQTIELILLAGFTDRKNKLTVLTKFSNKLDTLKLLLQIAWELKIINNKQYLSVSAPLSEVGKMLGGWQKQVLKETPPQGGD